ncbi:MAG: hydrolase 1, exosortase A system-associated [Roseibium album]|uniref:hydrolase 1, exosortase A system-associated n=1 Tax=Roseibium album TaxID=311410 RepID=UPI0032EC6C21
MNEEVILFECCGDRLIGILHNPGSAGAGRGGRKLVVLNVVGGPQYRVGSHRQFVQTARHLARTGYPVFRFDYRGIGDSDGHPRGFASVGADIEAAIDAVHRRLPGREIVLMGLCDGASAVMMFVNQHPELAGVVAINPWVRSASGQARTYVRHYYGRRLASRDLWTKLLRMEVNFAAAIGGFVRTWLQQRSVEPEHQPDFIAAMLRGVRSSSTPLLVVLSGADLTAREFDALTESNGDWGGVMNRSATSVKRLERADHTFSTASDLEEFNNTLVGWLDEMAGIETHRGQKCH